MIAKKIKCKILGYGIAYKKKAIDIPYKTYMEMKKNYGSKTIFYYCKIKGGHYTQSGFKAITYNPDRYECYHREPTPQQLKAITRKESRNHAG